jgi:hypothetical protein
MHVARLGRFKFVAAGGDEGLSDDAGHGEIS